MNIVVSVCGILIAVISALYLYTGIYVIIGFFTTRHFAPAKKNHRYGIVIAARNEETVIGDLIASIRAQRYPAELITVFVVADNCTDRTAAAARTAGAVCYERTDPDHRTKGYALQYLFSQIHRDYGTNAFEGFLILDADNILQPDYMEKMNNAFDSGEKIISSYRNTRNLNEGCIAASYAIHWMRTIRLEHRARSVLRLAGRLQGTGILFASELVKNGWNYTLLTEDRSFCADAVVNGYSISYQDEAEFFDEQPTSLRIAFRQRIRWSKGHLQAFACYGPKLFFHIFTAHGFRQKFMSFDMFLITLPQSLILTVLGAVSVIAGLLSWLTGLAAAGMPAAAVIPPLSSFLRTASPLLSAAGLNYLRQTAMAAYVMLMERRHLQQISFGRALYYCLAFIQFDLIGTISMCIAAVTHVDWKPIPHHGSGADPISLTETPDKKTAL